jgi:hypothetical protein
VMAALPAGTLILCQAPMSECLLHNGGGQGEPRKDSGRPSLTLGRVRDERSRLAACRRSLGATGSLWWASRNNKD